MVASRDGRTIVFGTNGALYASPADGGDVIKLTDGEDHHANWGAAPGS